MMRLGCFSAMRRRPGWHPVMVLAALIVALHLGFALVRPPRVPAGEAVALQILRVASSLIETGHFADPRAGNGQAALEAARVVAPGYPHVIAWLSRLDGAIATGAACYGYQGIECQLPMPFMTLIGLQSLVACLCLLFAGLLAQLLSGSRDIAVLTTMLVLAGGRITEFSRFLSGQVFVWLLILATLYCAVLSLKRATAWPALLAGASLGLLALFEPVQAGLLAAATGASLLAIPRDTGAGLPRRALRAAACLGVMGLVVLPWLRHSWAVFGDCSIAPGHVARQISQRLAYNAMGWREWLAGLVLWFPVLGDIVAPKLFDAAILGKLALYQPGSYLSEGDHTQFQQAHALAGSYHRLGGELSKRALLEHSVATGVTSIVLFWRGLWGGNSLVSVAGAWFLESVMRITAIAGERGQFLAVLVPAVCLAGGLSLLSPNLYWTNIAMLFVFSYAIARVSGGF